MNISGNASNYGDAQTARKPSQLEQALDNLVERASDTRNILRESLNRLDGTPPEDGNAGFIRGTRPGVSTVRDRLSELDNLMGQTDNMAKQLGEFI